MLGQILANHHLVIGDSHSKPEVDNRRFRWLSNLVLDTCLKHPEDQITVIDIGDWEDMPSLSSYDIGKRCYEGRRYQKDIAAAVEARQLFRSAIDGYNLKQKANKRRQISPRLVALGGNHFERRIERAIEDSPLLDGTISVRDGKAEEYGWEYVPFLTPKEIDGISYCHYFQGNGTSQPIAMGKYPAQVLLREKHSSCVVGHNHLWDVATGRNAKGEKLFALSAGCYLDPEQHESYAGQNNKSWTRCITILYDVVDGFPRGGFNMIPIETIQKLYDY